MLIVIARVALFVPYFAILVVSFVIASVLTLPFWLMPISEKRQEQISLVVQQVVMAALWVLIFVVIVFIVVQGMPPEWKEAIRDFLGIPVICNIEVDLQSPHLFHEALDAARRAFHFAVSRGKECLD